MSQREYDLGTAELEVLTELWNEEPATVRQVLTRLRARGRRLAYTTVLTFLTRLEQKGFVTSDKSGLAYVYRAAVSRERVQQSRLKSLLQELYDGAAGSLALQLVRNERLSADEVAELARLIDKLDGKAKRRGKKKE